MNAVVSESDSREVVDFRAPGPGERLKNARLAREIDLPKIAERLHLTVDMVEAIECDDYSELPARVFVRGYIRNYARLVELPIDSIISQFDQLWPEDESQVKVHTAPSLPTDSRPANRLAGSVTWVLLIVGIGLFLMWWQGYLGRFTDDPPSTSAQLDAAGPSLLAEQDGAEDNSLSLPPPLAADDAPPPVLIPAPVQGSGTLRLPAQPPAPVGPAPAPQVVASAPEPPPVPLAQPAPTVLQSSSGSTATETSVAAAASRPVVESPGDPAPVAASGVQIQFKQDCWVDIRDSSGSYRLFGTKRKGMTRVLGGTPPYKMTLGNVAGIAITVDGKPFDLGPFTNNNVAKLRNFTP